MRWSAGALPQYLFGLKSVYTPDADNLLMEMFIPGDDHVVGDKRVPTNFFAQPGAENVSGVLFSNAGTLAKFNRITKLKLVKRQMYGRGKIDLLQARLIGAP